MFLDWGVDVRSVRGRRNWTDERIMRMVLSRGRRNTNGRFSAFFEFMQNILLQKQQTECEENFSPDMKSRLFFLLRFVANGLIVKLLCLAEDIRSHMTEVYAVPGIGLIVGIINYLRDLKRCFHTSRITNFIPLVKWDSNWDRREDVNEANATFPRATRHLILICHGEYDFEAANDTDKRLTALGRKQAELTGLRLKELNFPYTRIVQSAETWAVEISTIIQKHLQQLPVVSCSLLCEETHFSPKPPTDELRHTLEDISADGSGIEAAFKEYFHRADVTQRKDTYEIFVCHANVIRYFICRALQFPLESWFSLFNCSLTWITVQPSGRVVADNIGDCGHLPPEMVAKRSTNPFES